MNTRTASLLVVAVVAGSVLSGCGFVQNRVEDAVGNAVEEGVERAIEQGGGGDVDLDFDGDGASLPNNFPGDVPQPNGRIIASIGSDTGSVVSFETDEAGVQAFLAEFSGWNVDSEGDYGDSQGYNFSNDRYTVALMITPSDTGRQVTYSISLKN